MSEALSLFLFLVICVLTVWMMAARRWLVWRSLEKPPAPKQGMVVESFNGTRCVITQIVFSPIDGHRVLVYGRDDYNTVHAMPADCMDGGYRRDVRASCSRRDCVAA